MKHNAANVDALLRRALRSTETTSPELVARTKQIIREESALKNRTLKRSFGTVVAAIITAVLIPATAFAAWHFLSPSQVADEFEYPALAEAFDSDDALLVNETKSDEGYDVSFLGIVSGDGLTALDNTVDAAKTYAVVAIAKQGGVMPNTSDDAYGSTPFFVSPLIHGQKPWQFNAASMGGGYSACVVDGLMYRLIECDSMEMFADRGLSLVVSSTDFYSVDAFDYNESTGLVSPNAGFDGVNLVFDLPLDTKNADHEKAQKYLDTLWDNNTAEAEESPIPDGEVGRDITITADGITDKEVMTAETMTAWIAEKLAETQKKVDGGEYSAASMELDRRDYESYLKAIKDGMTVTLITGTDGSQTFAVIDPDSGLQTDINTSDDKIEIDLRD
jgi:hypothetical protein